jgi:hypothetical protein
LEEMNAAILLDFQNVEFHLCKVDLLEDLKWYQQALLYIQHVTTIIGEHPELQQKHALFKAYVQSEALMQQNTITLAASTQTFTHPLTLLDQSWQHSPYGQMQV